MAYAMLGLRGKILLGFVGLLVILLAVSLLLGMAVLAQAKDLALVSNKGNGLSEITMAELVKVCKAQVNKWPDGKPATFVS